MPAESLNEPGWIADLAACVHPTQTELIEMGMIPRRPRYPGYEFKGDAERMRRWKEADKAWEGLRDPLVRRMTALVEVKTSRADFRGDRKWKAPWPCDLAYLAVPKGMVRPEEYPEGWGILEDGSKCIRRPVARVCTMEQHLFVIYAIALRRDHHTRYARHREEARQERIDEGDRRKEHRIQNLADAVFAVAHGGSPIYGPFDSVEAVVDRYLRGKCPPGLIHRLRKIWRVAVKDG